MSRRRRSALVGAGVVVLLVALIGARAQTSAGTASSEHAHGQVIPTTPTGVRTVQQVPARTSDDSGIPGVLAWTTSAGAPGALVHTHVTGPVTYAVTPPVGGPHNIIWMNAGTYTAPVPSERAVHDIEHGAIWITYRPGLPRREVEALVAFVGRQSLIDESATSHVAGQRSRYLLLSPWRDAGLPSPIVLSSWGYQLRVAGPHDPRMQQFVDTFRHSRQHSPEHRAPVDGRGVDIGGRAAADGASEPNPARDRTESGR